MKLNGFAEASETVASFKKLLLAWEKHCTTLHALADQIMAIERCDKEEFSVAAETFSAVKDTIQSKIVVELHGLSNIIKDMEGQQATLASLLNKMFAQSQSFLKQNEKHIQDFEKLQLLDSFCTHMSVLVSMKNVPLQQADPDNYQSLQEFKQMSVTTKSLEVELEKLSSLLDK